MQRASVAREDVIRLWCSVTCGSGEAPIGVQFLTCRHAWLVVLRRRQASRRLGKETLLPKGKVKEPVPIIRDAGGHRLLFGPALAGDPDGLGIASPLGKPLEQLVGCYLCMLGDERVAGVLDRFVGA